MIRAIIGKAGGGKTYFLMHCIEMELVQSSRWVVTNLTDINVPEFQEYLWKKYKAHKTSWLDLSMRLQIIPKTETRNWYRYRGHFTAPEFHLEPKKTRVELPEETDKRMEEYFRAVNERDSGGVAYFLDEAHRHFSALEWATFAEIGVFYISQHRHLNDTFWFSTQFPEQVNTTLRRSPQDCHLIRNHYLESYGPFQKAGCFQRSSYNFVPESKAQSEAFYDRGTMKLDPNGIGRCYRTRGALGGEIKVAEDKPKSRKLPYWSMFVFAALAFAALFGVLSSLPSLVGKGLGAFMNGTQKAVFQAAGLNEKKGPKKVIPEPQVQNVGPNTPGTPKAVEHVRAAPQVVWTMVTGRSYRVLLTDGKVLTDRDGLVKRIDRWGVELKDGQTLTRAAVASHGKE